MNVNDHDGGVRPTPRGDLEDLEMSVCLHAHLAGADETDPASIDWRASVELNVFQDPFDDEDELGDAPADGQALSFISLDDGSQRWTILRASGLVLDMWRIQDAWDALDARSTDYAMFLGLIDPDDPTELHPDIQDRLKGFGHSVVIIDRVRLAPAWRGRGGVGRVLTSRILSLVSNDSVLVATYPFPIDVKRQKGVSGEEFDHELAKVRHTWESIGFEQFDDKVWIMDPALAEHERAVSELESRLNL